MPAGQPTRGLLPVTTQDSSVQQGWLALQSWPTCEQTGGGGMSTPGPASAPASGGGPPSGGGTPPSGGGMKMVPHVPCTEPGGKMQVSPTQQSAVLVQDSPSGW